MFISDNMADIFLVLHILRLSEQISEQSMRNSENVDHIVLGTMR